MTLRVELMCWEVIFDVPAKKLRLQEIEELASKPEFWSNQEDAQKLSRERSQLTSQVENIDNLLKSLEDAGVFLELFEESKDLPLLEECDQELEKIEKNVRGTELERMFSQPHDHGDAILEVNAGAGGTEAQDWGEMLLRMYIRFAEKNDFAADLVDILPGDGAGIKSAMLIIRGENAYGHLRSEQGVHRLVRISPFDSNKRRHTSFASISVMPDIDEEIEIEVRDEDLRIDTYRSSGAGGQHVNKTDSAVRLTHLPTGIVVACQSERSQHKNKATAMKLLKAKLYELEEEKKKQQLDKIAGERKRIEFGSQIRSYVMQPYQLVKDLRTDVETGNVQAVLDGDLLMFIEGYLLAGKS